MEFDRCGPVGALLAADQLDEMDVEECHQAQKGTHRFAPALLSVEVSKHTVNLS